MFASLHEAYTNTPSDTVAALNSNITRYGTTEKNFVNFNTVGNYNFTNSGLQAQKMAAANKPLLNALSNLKTSENFTDTGATIAAIIQGVPDNLGAELAACRQYEGMNGLSKLIGMKQTGDSRCGWRYQKGVGPIPPVSQAAYGTRGGPLDPAVPQQDSVGGPVKWFWNLADAQRQMINDTCSAATSCLDMTAVPVSAAGDFSNLCGYCTTSQKVIPVEKKGNKLVARYNQVGQQCAPANIISVADAATKCPAPDPNAPPSQAQPYWKCFSNPLDRDCVTLSAMYAGCSPEGTLVSALNAGTDPKDFAAQLRNKNSFKTYQSLAQPVLNNDMLTSGNTTLFAAFFNNYNVNRNMYNQQNEKLRVAATDLCRQAGLYDSYNFCSDLTDQTTDYAVSCMQQIFLQMGGTANGSAYPNAKPAQGTTWGAYKASIQALVTKSQSQDPTTQREGLNALTGLGLQAIPTNLGRSVENQGVETFWFDRQQGGVCLGRRPTLSSTGSNIPNFNDGGGITQDTGLADWVEFVSFCDLRPAQRLSLMFGVVTDDGFAMTINQDLFNVKDQGKAFSAYYDQGPTWHQSGCMPVEGESTGIPNILTYTFFESGGGAMFQNYFLKCVAGNGWQQTVTGGNVNNEWKDMCYFTQDINGPSLSFEVYSRNGQTNFCEKRMWSRFLQGPSANGFSFAKVNDPNMPQGPSALVTGSQWTLQKGIAFTGFRTVTVCFCIDSFGSAPTLFYWGVPGNWFGNYITGRAAGSQVFLKLSVAGPGIKWDSPEIPVNTRTWYMATIIQTTANASSRPITGIKFFVQTVANLAAGNTLNGIQVHSYSPGRVIYDEYKRDRRLMGRLFLGDAQQTTRFAWVHFFDQALDVNDPSIWKTEISQSWKGRWYE